jgi:hypothetical protein
MREILLTAVVAAAVLSGRTFGDRLKAMPLAAPPKSAIAAAVAAHFEHVATICSINGCAPVQTLPLRQHRLPPHLGSPSMPNAEPYSLTAQLRRLRSGQALTHNTLP